MIISHVLQESRTLQQQLPNCESEQLNPLLCENIIREKSVIRI
jgi:hypothetical protein